MRKVIYGGACSLDGFFAAGRRGHRLAALQQGRRRTVMKQSWANTDTMLIGRKTWERRRARAAAAGRRRA